VACSQASNDVVVGGHDHGWKVPVQPDGLNHWSSIHRFQVGDNLGTTIFFPAVVISIFESIDWHRNLPMILFRLPLFPDREHALLFSLAAAVFKYDDGADSVLEVTRDDYNRCSTTSPLATHKAASGGAGRVTVPLPRSGPFYFISGKPGSCQMGQRVVVVVISEKHSRRGFFAPAAAPSMADGLVGGPALAPAPATGAAGRAAGSFAVLLAAAVLGAALVGL
jgi:hypothetical protein